MTLLAERPDEVDESELVVGRRIQEFSQLAGPISAIDPDGEPYRVSYRGVDAVNGRGRVARSLLVAALNFAFEALFFLWLLHPSHRPAVTGPVLAQYANWVVIASIGLMELLRLINVLSLSLASVISRDPVPVAPEPDQRVAFLTTIVPSKEPIDVVRGTLQAALRIRYRGILDVWILDEGDDPAVKAMCRELGVNHFTRHGVAKYNQRKGAFRARTKHGNYNAWVAEHGDSYEVFLSVDPDHVPLPNYAERILGYFRDPDVAFVVGPQCYANDETFVTRAAESQQFPFHSLIQRAANRYNSAMLVGTNNALRISALKRVGGLSDSITEDLATGLKIHANRNPRSGRRWKSVYTPDVLAVGEGPSSWGDFFSQQMRWSRGTFEVLLRDMWRRIPRLSAGRGLHYLLISTFYPSMAVGWILGAINACLFLALGVQGVVVPVGLWLALYVDATAFQLWVYLRNRRYNVSPYEPEGSSGVKGMLMSIFASPIFAASLIATLLRLPARFVVTPKGVTSSADRLLTFRRHFQWAALLIAAIITSVALGYASPAVLLWPAVALIACLAPPILWVVERVVGRDPAMEAGPPSTAEGHKGMTTESLERAALDAMIAEGSTAPGRSPVSVPFPAVLPDMVAAGRVPAGARTAGPGGSVGLGGSAGPRSYGSAAPPRAGHAPRDGSPTTRVAPLGGPGARPGPPVLPAAASAGPGGPAGPGGSGRPGAPLPRGWVRQGGPGVGPGERYRTQDGARPNGPSGGPPGLAGPGPRTPRHGAPTGTTPTMASAGSGPNGQGHAGGGPNGSANGSSPQGRGRHTSEPAGPAGPSGPSVPSARPGVPPSSGGTPDGARPAEPPWSQRNVPLPPSADGEASPTTRLAPTDGRRDGEHLLHTPDRPSIGDDRDDTGSEDGSSERTSTVAVRVVALAAVARPAAPARPAAAPEVVGPRARPEPATTGAGSDTEAS